MTRPGERLRAFAQRCCDPQTMERLIDPVIADLQCEHGDAIRRGQIWQGHRALVNGYMAFWKVVAIGVGAASTRALTARHDGAVGRIIRLHHQRSPWLPGVRAFESDRHQVSAPRIHYR